MLRLFSVVSILSVLALPIYGQGHQKTIDSLISLLDKTKDTQRRVDLLNDISSSLYDFNSLKGLEYSTKAYTLANQIKYLKGQRRALTLQGFYYAYATGEFEKALSFYRKASAVSIPPDDLFAYNLVMIGNVYRAIAHYDSAQFYYFKAIDALTKSNSPARLAFAYKNLGRLYAIQWKNKEAENAFEKALDIYKQTGNKPGIADTWFSLSEVSKNKANFKEANQYVQQACSLADDLDEELLKLQCLLSQGNISYRLGNNMKALDLYFSAMEILKSKDMPLTQATLYSGFGDAYEELGQNDAALKYYLEALKIAERIGIKHEIAKLLNNVAWIYKNQRNFELAHQYIENSLKLRTEIHDDHGISGCYNVIGIIYMQEKKYEEAIASLERSLEIRNRIGHREGIAACLFNLALVYEELKQYQKALVYQERALALDAKIGNKFSVGVSYNSMGNLYTKLKKYKEAQKFLAIAGKLAEETQAKSLIMNNNLFWSQFFEAKKDFPKSLQYYKKFSAINDSIYYEVSAHKMAELQALYQIEKKDKEIELLNQQKLNQQNEIKLQKAQIDFQNILIISAISGFVLVSLLAFLYYKMNRRINRAHREITEQKEEIQSQSEELIEANQTIADINKQLEGKIEERTQALSQAYKELDTFFYRSSHDFRRPLTTFLGLAEVAKITVKDATALELFEKVRETATNLDKMLVKLQSISDVGSQQLVYKEVMIKEIFETVCDTFREALHRKNIKTGIEIKLTDRFISYPAMVKIIIENLVENSIYFSGVDNPYVRLKVTQNGDYITMDFVDNGQGIPKEYQERVFDMYFRANERSKGNGLGLYIVKKAVEKLEGSISLSSIPLTGSTFTIMLPKGSS